MIFQRYVKLKHVERRRAKKARNILLFGKMYQRDYTSIYDCGKIARNETVATKATIKIHYYHNECKKRSVRKQVKARLNASNIVNDIDIDIDNNISNNKSKDKNKNKRKKEKREQDDQSVSNHPVRAMYCLLLMNQRILLHNESDSGSFDIFESVTSLLYAAK